MLNISRKVVKRSAHTFRYLSCIIGEHPAIWNEALIREYRHMRKLGRENGKLTDYFTIITGTLLMAVAANWLYSPANMVPGGFTGLAIILQEMTKGIRPGGVPIWFWNTVLNVPLILLSIRARGWKFMRRTFIASVVFSVWLFLVPEYNLIKGDLLLVSVIGGGIMGAGLGLVFLGKATTGGTDTLAALIQRAVPQYNAARIMPVLDAAVILISIWIFGINISMYAIITVILSGRIADKMINGLRDARLVYVISEKHGEIARTILEEMNRGVTLLPGIGLYTSLERPVLMCAVSRKQAVILRDIVADIDPRAFFVLTNASEIRGEGFREYSKEEF